jgi:predicted ArsR family transcriptional regulator
MACIGPTARKPTPQGTEHAARFRAAYISGVRAADIAIQLGLKADTVKSHFILLRHEGVERRKGPSS